MGLTVIRWQLPALVISDTHSERSYLHRTIFQIVFAAHIQLGQICRQPCSVSRLRASAECNALLFRDAIKVPLPTQVQLVLDEGG